MFSQFLNIIGKLPFINSSNKYVSPVKAQTLKNNAERIEKTLNSLSIQVDVKEIDLNLTSMSYHVKLLNSGTIDDVKKFSRDLALVLASPTGKVGIEKSKKKASDIAIILPYDKNTLSKTTYSKKVIQNAQAIEKLLNEHNLIVRIVGVDQRDKKQVKYLLEIAYGMPVDEILQCKNEIAIAVKESPEKIKIQAPIPGRSLIGISISNNS